MSKKRFFNSRIKTILDASGKVYRLNPLKEFFGFVNSFPCHFADHYKLFKKQTGVYRFNADNRTIYIGYSENLQNRVLISYFNHAFGRHDVTFQYLLCDSKEEALKIESYYIKTLQPVRNVAGKSSKFLDTSRGNYPEFCKPMRLQFYEYWIENKPGN